MQSMQALQRMQRMQRMHGRCSGLLLWHACCHMLREKLNQTELNAAKSTKPNQTLNGMERRYKRWRRSRTGRSRS